MATLTFLLVWVFLSFLVGSFASGKNRSFAAWLLLSLLVSPLIGGIFLLVAGPKPKESPAGEIAATGAGEESKTCPSCAERIKVEALKCRYCGHVFDPSDVQRKIAERDRIRMQGYALVETGVGEAYCIKCHSTSPIVGMFHHRASDSYYHKGCLG